LIKGYPEKFIKSALKQQVLDSWSKEFILLLKLFLAFTYIPGSASKAITRLLSHRAGQLCNEATLYKRDVQWIQGPSTTKEI
jgi:hypothetical protein